MRQLTYDECIALLASIRSSPSGSWTHDLQVIAIGPVRFVDRVQIPIGHEVVYFRGPDGPGAWPAANWDRFAEPRAVQEPQHQDVEQLTLF